jgi:hypothetical protein
MNRRPALAGVTGAAISGCGRPPRLRLLRVSTLPRIISTPLYLADERGYFGNAGLELDFQPLAEAAQITPLLAAGRIDVAFAGVVAAVFNAIARGARFRVVAARDVAIAGCTSEIYGSRHASPRGFPDVRELKGKRVAAVAPETLESGARSSVRRWSRAKIIPCCGRPGRPVGRQIAWQTFATERLYIAILSTGALGGSRHQARRVLEERVVPWKVQNGV